MSAPPDRKPNDSLTSNIKDDSKRKLSFSQNDLKPCKLGSGNINDNNSSGCSNSNRSNLNPSQSHHQQQQQQRAQQLNAAGLRNKPAGPGGAPSDSTPGGGGSVPIKIDSEPVNVAAAETVANRVILNVGGIRHETYKVIEQINFSQCNGISI